jgi:centromere protein C
VGKKTGIKVQQVERKSDGFEPFEELLQQADGRTPPRPKGRRKSLAMMGRHDEDYDEEDGEMSMQLDSMYHFYSQSSPH